MAGQSFHAGKYFTGAILQVSLPIVELVLTASPTVENVVAFCGRVCDPKMKEVFESLKWVTGVG